MIEEPILKSMLDDDLYKITMGQVIFHHFPRVKVTYTFKNRNQTPFPQSFLDEFKHQLNLMGAMKMTFEEKDYLHTIPFLRPTYIEWLHSYRFNPHEVKPTLEGDQLVITIGGYWYRTIFWEVRLMALISELYFKLTGAEFKSFEFARKTTEKTNLLKGNGCHWIDFGTRRRFSYQAQDIVQQAMHSQPGFLGTSNVHFAMKYGMKAHGTYAHESIMGMSGKFGVRGANLVWMKLWAEHYEGNLGVALTDTYTTDLFLKDFGTYEARLFDGVRHDSGVPEDWAEKMISHYQKLGIPTTNKRFVFSDNLKVADPSQRMIGNSYNYVTLAQKYQKVAQPVGGIGTYLTNDCGHKPLNMVIKLKTIDFGDGPKEVVKISDEHGKYTGHPDAIRRALEDINL
jgi:nicotinate phosphoribosyltransferase